MEINLPQVKGKYRHNVEVGKLCWFGAGGKAAVVFMPSDLDDLIHFFKSAKNTPIFVMGVGSNLLIRDGGFEGVVIRLNSSMTYLKLIGEDIIEAGAAVLDSSVANFALDHLIGGMEFLCGIPGTVGGGLAMNGGAYGREFSDIVSSVSAMDYEGNVIALSNADMQFKYRGNNVSKNLIFLKAYLKGHKSSADEIAKKMREIKNQRNTTQPVKGFKTGGSTFKNPPGLKAWQLIDQAGCRGLRIGNAQMSELHCNFLINNGSATARDIETLIEVVKQKVFNSCGIMLEEEIVFLGNKL